MVLYVDGDAATHLLTHSQVYTDAAANSTAAGIRFSAASRNGMDAPARHGIRCAKVEALCSTT